MLCTTPVWIPPYSLQFTTQWGSRSCYTSRQWTRCEKLLQCFSLHRQLEVIRNAQLNLLSAEQADFILVHTNMFYHVCTQGQPALHQLTTAARGSVKAPKSLTHCTEQHSWSTLPWRQMHTVVNLCKAGTQRAKYRIVHHNRFIVQHKINLCNCRYSQNNARKTQKCLICIKTTGILTFNFIMWNLLKLFNTSRCTQAVKVRFLSC